MHHPTNRIIHTTAFVTPVVEHWLEREIAQWVHPMKDRSDDPSHHERTLLPRSYISLLHVTEIETCYRENDSVNVSQIDDAMINYKKSFDIYFVSYLRIVIGHDNAITVFRFIFNSYSRHLCNGKKNMVTYNFWISSWISKLVFCWFSDFSCVLKY